jgi:hypothetical protein
MLMTFFSSATWESWGLSSQPVIPDRMPILLDDDLLFEDSAGPRVTTVINRWAQELPANGCPAPNSRETYVRVMRDWTLFLASRGIQLFDSRRELRRGLSAYAVHRACGPLKERFAASTWNQHMSILSLFYGWAEDEELTTAVPFTYKQAVTAYGDQVRLQSVNLSKRRTPKPHVTIKYFEKDFEDTFRKGLGGLRPDGAENLSYWDQTGHFIRWATKNRLAKGLIFGAERWQGPVGPHDSEGRWDDARRLLHDDTLPTADRVAGLLLLFYAQRLSTISTLTVDQVSEADGRVSIQLGTTPTVLPEPLAALVLDLIATRRPYTVIGHADQTPWLFPGQRPGQHVSADRLGQRLIAAGIQPGQARSTALFALAEEVPAAILARMLGIHIRVAVQWQKASAGDWAAYAADVSRRSTTPPSPNPSPTSR